MVAFHANVSLNVRTYLLEVVDKATLADTNTALAPGSIAPAESEDSDTIWLLGLIAASLLLTAGAGLFARSKRLRDQ